MSYSYGEWQPSIVSTQLAFIGSVAIAGVPGEFTTMAGRRLRDVITDCVKTLNGPNISQVIVAGLSNSYSSYITTPEEYQVKIGSVL
jgi:neutral ceramidase